MNEVPLRSRILGAGMKVPDTVITNDDLSEVLDTNDEWIQQRSGIRERRYLDGRGGSTALGAEAARVAVAQAGLEMDDIDAVICGTLSPDVEFPHNHALLSDALNLSPRMAFDTHNQCSGFIYSVAAADQLVRTGGARNVLVVGSEVHSTGLEYADRSRHVTVLFGDGAGAVVVGPSEDDERGILGFNLHCRGEFAEKLSVLGPACRHKPRCTADQVPGDQYLWPYMEGRLVFKHAVTGMTDCIQEVCEEVGVTVDDIDMLVPHQANLRINQLVAMGLKIGDDRMVNNIDRYGNTTNATIPILLTETLAAGRIQPGDLVCLAAFGAGFTWGSMLLRW
jgi:3-oxoacyl-[acyl-carrier-protein] synthase-3